jgi:dienelactone hydrolase
MRPLQILALALLTGGVAAAQEYGPPDRGAPGDAMIQAYLARETEKLETPFLEGIGSRDNWEKLRPRYQEEYYYMLGLAPMPAKTPLAATVTGTLSGDGYVVEMLHYQSRPRLYVTGNLYRPAQVKPGERLPAVFYPCGHSYQGRSGNKTAYQSHGIWFARHGYICLVVDSLQLGEIAGIHHGTYREGRWWWQSRGYAPSGVECLNGIRGIDYLTSRPDVDPARIAVTGISGGGAATFWIAAADPRVQVAVPVSGLADLRSYVTNRVINGHCDCMFLYNAFQWPWARIAALVAPRPLMFTNSDHDAIFPMDANERVINRLKRVYSLFGASDRVAAFVSIGEHAYRQDIRQGAYRFINTYFKDDPRIVGDSERDLIAGSGPARHYPLEPERLRVFPKDSDIPADQLNTTIDRHFVPPAEVALPAAGQFAAWKKSLADELRRVTFRYFPERIPAARLMQQTDANRARLETEPGIEVGLVEQGARSREQGAGSGEQGAGSGERGAGGGGAAPRRIILIVENPATQDPRPKTQGRQDPSTTDHGRLPTDLLQPGDTVYVCLPRGVGPTRWTAKDPPNYVARSHALLGRTVDTGRVWDIAATARYLAAKHGSKTPVWVAGAGPAGVLAAYAALWEPEIAGVILRQPPVSHMESAAPPLLNVLRVCDIPDVLGMLAPRPLALDAAPVPAWRRAAAVYAAAGQPDRFTLHEAKP